MYTKFNTRLVLKYMNLWPPFLGAGVKVKIPKTKDLQIDVSMNLKITNKNMFGTHFGGSLYAMVDPFYAIILFERLNKEYLVWDKEASIKFKKPGKGNVTAHFEISDSEVEDIKREVAANGKYEPIFSVDIKNSDGETVAEVTKKLWVKKKE